MRGQEVMAGADLVRGDPSEHLAVSSLQPVSALTLSSGRDTSHLALSACQLAVHSVLTTAPCHRCGD